MKKKHYERKKEEEERKSRPLFFLLGEKEKGKKKKQQQIHITYFYFRYSFFSTESKESFLKNVRKPLRTHKKEDHLPQGRGPPPRVVRPRRHVRVPADGVYRRLHTEGRDSEEAVQDVLLYEL